MTGYVLELKRQLGDRCLEGNVLGGVLFSGPFGFEAVGSPLIKYSQARLSLFPTCTLVLTGTLAGVKAIPFP